MCDFDGTYSPHILEIVHSDFVVIALSRIGDVWIEEVLIVSSEIFPFYRKAQICQCQTHKILEKKMKVFFNKEQKSIRFYHQLKQKFVVIVQSKA